MRDRGLYMSLVIHYWIGDVQDSQGVSASEMPYIVSGGALNSTQSLAVFVSFKALFMTTVHCVFTFNFGVENGKSGVGVPSRWGCLMEQWQWPTHASHNDRPCAVYTYCKVYLCLVICSSNQPSVRHLLSNSHWFLWRSTNLKFHSFLTD